MLCKVICDRKGIAIVLNGCINIRQIIHDYSFERLIHELVEDKNIIKIRSFCKGCEKIPTRYDHDFIKYCLFYDNDDIHISQMGQCACYLGDNLSENREQVNSIINNKQQEHEYLEHLCQIGNDWWGLNRLECRALLYFTLDLLDNNPTEAYETVFNSHCRMYERQYLKQWSDKLSAFFGSGLTLQLTQQTVRIKLVTDFSMGKYEELEFTVEEVSNIKFTKESLIERYKDKQIPFGNFSFVENPRIERACNIMFQYFVMIQFNRELSDIDYEIFTITGRIVHEYDVLHCELCPIIPEGVKPEVRDYDVYIERAITHAKEHDHGMLHDLYIRMTNLKQKSHDMEQNKEKCADWSVLDKDTKTFRDNEDIKELRDDDFELLFVYLQFAKLRWEKK